MAIATFSPLSTPLRGKVGGLIFKHYGDKIVVTRAPTFSKPWSAAQQAGRKRFAQASAYARKVQADPSLRAKYATLAAQRGLTLRSVAISAYLQGKTEQAKPLKLPLRPPRLPRPQSRPRPALGRSRKPRVTPVFPPSRKNGAVEVTRTPDRRFRKPLLYPAELPPRVVWCRQTKRLCPPTSTPISLPVFARAGGFRRFLRSSKAIRAWTWVRTVAERSAPRWSSQSLRPTASEC